MIVSSSIQADIEEALLRRKKQELLEMYAIGKSGNFFRHSYQLLTTETLSDGDDLDKFAAAEEEQAMDTSADQSAKKSQAVESLRDVEGGDKPPGDEGAN